MAKKVAGKTATKELDSKFSKLKVLAEIQKAFGKDAIRVYDESQIVPMEFVSTGSMNLDNALGIGGFPQGRIIEIYGQESSGKTTLTLHVIAEAQKKGLICAFVDAEHALDVSYAKALGVNVQELLISQPDNGEQALGIVEMLVSSGEVGLVIVDSVAALTPRAEIEGDMGDSHMGLQARMMSQGLRKLTGAISNNKCTVVFINQMRMKIGVMFGDPNTTTGGNALKFYASVRIQVRADNSAAGKLMRKTEDGKDEQIGYTMIADVKKNKVGLPFKKAEIPIVYGKGINLGLEVYKRAMEVEIIENPSGGTHMFNDVKIAGSKGAAMAKLNSQAPEFDKDLFAQVYAAVKESFISKPIEQNKDLDDGDSDGEEPGEE